MPKLPPCCARREIQISRAYGELVSAARKHSRRPSAKLQADVDAAKARLAKAKESRDIHQHDESLEHC